MKHILFEIANKSWKRLYGKKFHFFYNPLTKESTWYKPQSYQYVSPHILSVSFRAPIPPLNDKTESWEFILLNNNDFFFFNKDTWSSSWNIPDIVKEMFQNIKVLSEKSSSIIQKESVIQKNDIVIPLEISHRLEQLKLQNNDVAGNENEESEDDSDSDEFELFDVDGEESTNINTLSVSKIDNMNKNDEKNDKQQEIGRKRKRETSLHDVGDEKVVKKVKRSGAIGNFFEMMDEGVENGKINENMNYQKFFMLYMRDVRFRKISDNEKRKKFFQERIEELKKEKR